ncbi:hypothetical protein Taro_050830 [Colocasia esculenta]|uniref:Uncharacterized protein n=1 Tax=Colocasia esculenta TaxID=4460 RepID=A0A843XEE2_COLES|nr:hypothetical protein [Colocasia esculenta]
MYRFRFHPVSGVSGGRELPLRGEFVQFFQFWIAQPPRRSLEGYKHVVDVENCPPVSSENPHFTMEAVKAKEAAQAAPNFESMDEYYHIVEVASIFLMKLVTTFQVKNEWLHNAGAGVIAHVADNLKLQESQSFIPANL